MLRRAQPKHAHLKCKKVSKTAGLFLLRQTRLCQKNVGQKSRSLNSSAAVAKLESWAESIESIKNWHSAQLKTSPHEMTTGPAHGERTREMCMVTLYDKKSSTIY